MSEIAELKEQLSLMQQRINELEQEQMAQPVQRRNMLKAVAGVAAGAAVGGLGFARPAAAAPTSVDPALADGDAFSVGNYNVAQTPSVLYVSATSTWDEIGGIFNVGDNATGLGAKLFNEDAGFAADYYETIRTRMKASAITADVTGDSGQIRNGISAVGNYGVSAWGLDVGMSGIGRNYGGQFQGQSAGLYASPQDQTQGVGAKLAGDTPLKLLPSDADLPEEASSGHFRFTGSDLYFGTDGGWKNLTNPASPEAPAVTGVFIPVTPFRVYDSRKVTNGRLSKGENAVVDCSDARADDHSIATADALPAGATAIAYNLTATGTGGAGFLSVAPGDVASTTVSTINWSSANIDIANSSIVKVDANRKVKVFCDGYPGAASDFIIDVVGYYK